MAVGSLECPDITREEIANACGLEDFHDGVNYMRTACVIAVAKAQSLFEPFIHQVNIVVLVVVSVWVVSGVLWCVHVGLRISTAV